jgi:hypothetical protein
MECFLFSTLVLSIKKMILNIKILFNSFSKILHKKRITRNYKISNSELDKFNSSLKKTSFNLDPLETRFLSQLFVAAESGISILEINKMFHLFKLSDVNQRVRRHIIVKEINLKLFMITDIRECIVRVASEDDKRKKYYYLIKEARSNQKTEKFIVSDNSLE